MVAHKFSSIRKIIDFQNSNNEPHTDDEKYILRAMWVMMMAEFEGSIKEIAENYITKIKKLSIDGINPCILLTHFSGEIYEEGTQKRKFPDNPIEKLSKIYELHDGYNQNNITNKNLIEEIDYKKFTKDEKPKYKFKEIIKLFNSLGIFFNYDEKLQLLKLESMGEIRNSIAHGDTVEITANELRENLTHLENIFKMLEKRLD